MTQKYFKGDLVVIGDMPECMKHFPSNCEAIVLHTYREVHGGNKQDEKLYCVYILPNQGETSWYHEDQLTFIRANQFKRLPKAHVDRKVWEAKLARDQHDATRQA